MPYNSVKELPKSVKDNLPVGAQKIFMGAFNGAIKQGKKEEDAFKIAWGAVKQKYRQISGQWVKKMMTTPAYIQQATLVREDLAGGRKKKPKKKPKKDKK